MTNEPPQTAEVGCWIRVREHGETEDERYVLSDTTDLGRGELGDDNAMGRAFRGVRVGEHVSVMGPVGEIKFEVVEFGRVSAS